VSDEFTPGMPRTPKAPFTVQIPKPETIEGQFARAEKDAETWQVAPIKNQSGAPFCTTDYNVALARVKHPFLHHYQHTNLHYLS
jgi:hypothetical protein